jgi:predicted small metal-binding protein
VEPLAEAMWHAKCDCGWEAQAPKGELVALIQQHAREVHSMEITPEQALAQARPA